MRLRLVASGAPRLDVVDGRIAEATGAPDLELRLPEGTLRPGLLNAHDHLHRNHLPRLGSPPYRDVYAWGDDLHARFAAELERRHALPLSRALLFGALKNVLGGATTVVHHDPWQPEFERGFPIRVARIEAAHSLRLDPGATPRHGAPHALHLAEGTGAAMADEVREADARGLLDARLLAVHLVGADDDGLRRLEHAGAAAVVCPTSNLFLYGATPPAALFSSSLDLLLGSDALVSGEGTLLDEIAAARRLGLLDGTRLEDAVGAVAARRLGLPAPTLAAGAPADLVLFRRMPGEAKSADVALVLCEGRPLLADDELADVFEACGVRAEPIAVGGRGKRVAAPLGSVAREVFDLTPECRRIVA